MNIQKLMLLTIGIIPVALAVTEIEAATFTVNSTGDGGDSNTADGVCDDGTGVCTLRAAIEQANATAGADTIEFDIAGAGPHTIQPASALPTITDPIVIDGTSEPDFAGSPIVELDGTNAGVGAEGLRITAGSCTVRGLVINRFDAAGIILLTSGNNLIEGNYIGTDVTGSTDLGNGGHGVAISDTPGNTIGGTTPGAGNVISGNNSNGVHLSGSAAAGNFVQGNLIGTDASGLAGLGNSIGVAISLAPDNVIGGTIPAARNIISGNLSHGVSIFGSTATGNVIQGNYIGTDLNGTSDLGNADTGVEIANANDNTIGGTAPGARNIISGNDRLGLFLGGASFRNNILGNFIGTDVTGTATLGNTFDGIAAGGFDYTIGGNVISGNGRWGVGVSGSGILVQGNYIGTDVTGTLDLGNAFHGVRPVGSNNTIGGTSAGAGNVIAFNGGDGVTGWAGTGNLIRHNSIYSNTGLGIDLEDDGITPNDAGDGDTGPNELQNFPVLTSVVVSGGSTTVEGTLNSTSGENFTLEFFSNSACDPSGNGEGETFLVSTIETTDVSGDATFTVVIGTVVPAGHFITATATDSNNNTSEFSKCIGIPLCGNGFVDAGEQCDDGASNSDTLADACRTNCTNAACGDGVTDTDEGCDDGGESTTCDADCTTAVCGDATLNTTSGETCDDGNTHIGDGCSSTCAVENGWVCTGEPSVCTSTAIPTVSEWGLVVLALLVLTAGTLVHARRLPGQA